MRRRTFLKTIFPTIFVPKLIVPVWKVIKPVPTHGFGTIILPQVNRVFPTITAHELVSVQPMNMPSATVFYMDFVTTSKSDDRFSTFI
jgi:hypothetical protein